MKPPVPPPPKPTALRIAVDNLLVWFGTAFRATLLLAIIIVVWSVWDTPDVINVPLARLTLGALFSVAIKTGALLGLGVLMCSPSQDREVRQNWGVFGLFFCLAVAVAAYLYLSGAT